MNPLGRKFKPNDLFLKLGGSEMNSFKWTYGYYLLVEKQFASSIG